MLTAWRDTSSISASCSCDRPRERRSVCSFSPNVISCSSIGFDGPSVANFRPKCHHPTLEFPQPNVARAVLRRFFILFQQSRHIQLHDEQAHEHQRRAEIAAHRQALAEQEIGEHGGEYRLEREDQARVARRGKLLLDALDDEADARAKHAEEQRRRPDLGRAGQARRLKKEGQPEHHHARHRRLQHAEGDGVDLRLRDRLLRHHQVHGVEGRHEQADDIARRGTQRLVERQERHACHAHRQGKAELAVRSLSVNDELKEWGKENGHRADEARVGYAGIQNAVGRAEVDRHERQPDENAVPPCFAARAEHPLVKHRAEHGEGREKAEGVERHRLHIAQANGDQAVGNAPKAGRQHQHHVGFSLTVHTHSSDLVKKTPAARANKAILTRDQPKRKPVLKKQQLLRAAAFFKRLGEIT